VFVCFFSFFSQGGQLVVLMPVLAACHLIYVFLPRCMECRRGLAMRILSLCLSVCPSVTRVNCGKTVERSVQIYIPY